MSTIPTKGAFASGEPSTGRSVYSVVEELPVLAILVGKLFFWSCGVRVPHGW